jgi:5-methylcytosine-specific restriction endonuclease McrA
MKSNLLHYIRFAKPKKSQRPSVKRKKEIKKLDRQFQESGETHICEVCKKWSEQTTYHHKKGRRHLNDRWNIENCIRVCYLCHDLIHRGIINI